LNLLWLFARESRLLLQALPNARSYIMYSRPGAGDRAGADFDAPGHLSVGVLREVGVPREADFYLCGPPPFLRDLIGGLSSWGVPHDRVHTEVFGPGESFAPGTTGAPRRSPHAPSGGTALGARVSFARSGLAVRWDPAFQSLLELAEACDVPVKWSCRTGVCHTCESGLIAGAVDYRPEPLDSPAVGNVLICCARPRDEVVVDL
jgi:ferredoxin-NADP reductase